MKLGPKDTQLLRWQMHPTTPNPSLRN